MVHRINSRTPVVFLEVPGANEDAKDLQLGRRPVKLNRRVRTATPATKPKALGLSQVELRTGGLLKQGESFKSSLYRVVRGEHQRRVVRILLSQWIERWTIVREVEGSSPAGPTLKVLNK